MMLHWNSARTTATSHNQSFTGSDNRAIHVIANCQVLVLWLHCISKVKSLYCRWVLYRVSKHRPQGYVTSGQTRGCMYRYGTTSSRIFLPLHPHPVNPPKLVDYFKKTSSTFSLILFTESEADLRQIRSEDWQNAHYWLTSRKQWYRERSERDAERNGRVLYVVNSWCVVSCGEVRAIADLDPCRWRCRQPDRKWIDALRRAVALRHDASSVIDSGFAVAKSRLQINWHAFQQTFTPCSSTSCCS